jgi:hypothetical protein
MGVETRDTITWTLGTFLTLCTIVALAVRFVLLPWLRDHLVGPLRETHRQVSENGHRHRSQPTIPDRLEDLATRVDAAAEAHEAQSRDLAAFRLVLDEHLRWSDRWVDITDRELEQLKRLVNKENGEPNDD